MQMLPDADTLPVKCATAPVARLQTATAKPREGMVTTNVTRLPGVGIPPILFIPIAAALKNARAEL